MIKKSDVQVGDVVLYLDSYSDETIGKVVELFEDSARICNPREGDCGVDYDDILKKYNDESLPLYQPEHFMEGDAVTFVYEDELFTGFVSQKGPLSMFIVEQRMGEMRVFYEEVLSVGDSKETKDELFVELDTYNQRNWRLYMINVALDKGDKDLFLAMTKELQSA